MNETEVRLPECDELETLNLLQADMLKRTEELKQLRLGLFPSVNEVDQWVEKVSSENSNDAEHVTICGLPEDLLESERPQNTEHESQKKDTLIERHVVSAMGKMEGPDNHHVFISGWERESEEKSIPWNDVIATKSKESVSLSAQSWSIPKLQNEQQGRHESAIPTSSDSSSSIHQDLVSSAAVQLEREAATGRVLISSLANENKLEEKLTLSELEVKSLKAKISQIEEHHVKEVNEHKNTIQVLLQRVDQVSKQKQEEVSNREKEAKAHEDVIFKLTGIVQNAEKVMGLLEKKLEVAKQDLTQERMLSGCQQEVLRQIYDAVKLAETDDSGDGTRETTTPQLMHKLVKRYVDRRENQVAELLRKQKEAEERCSKLQKEVEETAKKLNAEYKERFTQLIEDQNKQLEAANQRALNARQQTQGLQSQLQTVEQHSHLEIEAKSRQNSELSEQIKEQEKKMEKLISGQQTEVTRYRKELSKTREVLDDKDLQIANMEENFQLVEEKLKKTKENLENATRDLSESNKDRSKLDQLQLDIEKKLSTCQKMLQEKSEEIIKLKKRAKSDEDKYKKEHQDEISGLKKEMERKVMDEKKTSEENRRMLNEQLEKSEDNCKRKKCELKKTKELNKQQLSRIRELESNLEMLNQEKSESVLRQEKAERDLLMLQHERNLLENLYEKAKREAQVELKDKSRIENSLQEIEPRYRELLIENQKLSSEMEKMDEQSAQIESERSQLMLEVKDRDVRLEKLRTIKSEVDEELEVKDKILREFEGKLKEAEDLCKEKESHVENLKTDKEKLQQSLQQANDKVSQLTNERTSLMEVSSKQKTDSEKDRRILSSQIKILQNELRLVKGRMDIKNAAVNEQADIAVQQGLVESLQGEITWLEERLYSTQEILRKREEKVKEYQEAHKKAQGKIERLEKERKEMIRRKKEQKTLVLKLESALEKTSFMCRESQQQSEKQAQELARLKLQHQLELKELKGNLVNQLTNTFILPKLGNNFKNQVGTSEISIHNVAVGDDQLRTKIIADCDLDHMINQVTKEMEKKQEDGENSNISLQPFEANFDNSETKSSCSGQKKHCHVEAKCMSQRHGKRILEADESKCFSAPASSLSKPGSASSAKLDSPVSVLLSRGCLPQEMTKNTADLSNKTHLNAHKGADARLDKTELHFSAGHHQHHKMKGFVDKLDKLTAMGNHLIDENMDKMHIHERFERDDGFDVPVFDHVDKSATNSDQNGVRVPLRSISIPICFTGIILIVAFFVVYCTRRVKQQKERASEVVTIHRKRYVSNAYDSDSDAESVMNWQGRSSGTKDRSEPQSGSSSPTLSTGRTPPQLSPMKILPRQATVPLLQRQKQETFRQQRQLSLQLNLANIEFSVKNLSTAKRSQSSSLGSLNPDLYQDKHVEESTEDSCGRLYFNLFYDHPTETLNVHVHKATDLTAKDFCGTSDPYVKIYLYPDRRKKFQTKVIRKTCNPEFDERFAFQIPYNELSKRTLKFTIYDFDRFSRHDLIGEVTLTNMLQDHDLGVETEFIRNVVKGSGADKVDLGEILFSLCYLPTACRLTLTVIKARNLKAMDITGASDPYVKVSLMSLGKRIKKKKTAVKKNTLNPIYNEALVFDVTPETMDSVCFVIAVVDHDWVGHSELIGVCETGPFCIGQGKEHWEEMMANPRTPIAHWYQLQESAPSFSAAVVAGGLKNCMGNSQQSND